MTKQEHLNAICGRATLYELAAIRGDQRILIAYCGRRGRGGILAACRKRGAALVALTGAESIGFASQAADGATMGEWGIRFTGRTQRDAIQAGELAYVEDAVSA